MTRHSKNFRDRNPVIVGAVSLSVIIALVYVAFNAQSLPLIGGGTVYKAQFSEAAGLQADDPVRVAGVKVGKVESLSLEDGAVTVEFRVKDAFVGDRSEAAIKIETVLGAKYVALVPARCGAARPRRADPAGADGLALRRRRGVRRPVVDGAGHRHRPAGLELRGAGGDVRRDPGRGPHLAGGAGPAVGHDRLARRAAPAAVVGDPSGDPGAGRPQRRVHPADPGLEHPADRGAGTPRADRLDPHQHAGARAAALRAGGRQPGDPHTRRSSSCPA